MAQVIEVHPDNPRFNYVIYTGTPDELRRYFVEMVKLFNSINDGRQVTVVRPDFVVLELRQEGEEIQSRIIHYQIV